MNKLILFLTFILSTSAFSSQRVSLINEFLEEFRVQKDQTHVTIRGSKLKTLYIESEQLSALRIYKSHIDKIILTNTIIASSVIDEETHIEEFKISKGTLLNCDWPTTLTKAISIDLQTIGLKESYRQLMAKGMTVRGIQKNTFLYSPKTKTCENGLNQKGFNEDLGECSFIRGNLFNKEQPLPKGFGHNIGSAQTTNLSGKGLRLKNQQIQALIIDQQNLYGLEFADSKALNLKVTDSSLERVRMSGSQMDGVEFLDTIMSNSYLVSSNFNRWVVKNSVIVDLYSAENNFKDSEIVNTLLQMTIGKATTFTGGKMTGSKLIIRNPDKFKLDGVDLRGADLSNFAYFELEKSCSKCQVNNKTIFPKDSPSLELLPKERFIL